MATLMGIDFAALSLQDALDLAILIEEEARERYEDLAHHLEQRHTPDAARFFRFMALNEEKHRSDLAAQRRAIFGEGASRVSRTSLFEVEAPELDEIHILMSVREALQVALRAERKAWAFFSEALPQIRDHAVAALFRELRDEEVEHEQMVLAELRRASSAARTREPLRRS
jgi:rubrerythrin